MDLEHPSGSIKLFGVTISPQQNSFHQFFQDNRSMGSIKIFGVIFSPQQNPPPIAAVPIQSRNPNSDDHVANPAKRPRRSFPMIAMAPSPQLPQKYRDLLLEMGASVDDPSPVLIFSRALFNSDVKKDLNRLTIPSNQILMPFLTKGEEFWVQHKDADGKIPKKLGVKVIDPLMVERTMSLAKWNWKQEDKNRSWWYALTSNWMDVVNDNGLLVGDSIQLWSFRINARLGFIIHKVAAAAHADADADADADASPPSDQPQSK